MHMCMHTCILVLTHGARAQLTEVGYMQAVFDHDPSISVIQAWKVEPEGAVLEPGTEEELGGAS